MATPTLLHSNGGSQASTTSFALQFANAIGSNSNSTLFCFAAALSQPTANLTVSDDFDGSYVVDVTSGGFSPSSTIIARKSPTLTSAGSRPTVTVTSSVSATIYIVLSEWQNLDPSPFDQTAEGHNSSGVTSQSTSASGALAASGELGLVWVFGTTSVTSYTAGSGWTLDANLTNSNTRRMVEWQVAGSTSALTGTTTSTGATAYNMILATYKASGGAAPSVTPRGLLLGVGS